MSEIKVNSIKGVAATTAAFSINNTDGTATANLTNRQGRNLIINGAMQVAQRGTSSTTNGYGSVDRFSIQNVGTDEAPTHAQVDVASGTTPYTLGFRKALKITNGNQTSGAGTSDKVYFTYQPEAQDIANSGWNYTSTSSNITISFWVKSSVAQEFHGFLLTQDGTNMLYSFSLGSLSADTWTKVTKTISGNSNLQFNNDNGIGFLLRISMFVGTNQTGTITQDQWGTFNTNVRYPNFTSTWYTTNDATFEFTGLQVEVGSVATDFEHRSFAQELDLCRRYCQVYKSVGNYTRFATTIAQSSSSIRSIFYLKKQLRSVPTFSYSGNFQCANATNFDMANMALESSSTGLDIVVLKQSSMSVTANTAYFLAGNNDTSASITFNSEL